ncbi:hypothetical protein SAMN05216404_10137 [Nitrosospira multiformis]|uniref:Parallel beta helix pectate lyase-like protein n=1 Tax=Nitrosospira multiformis TaxID=1231 RepID=A0A1H8AXB0_9PROT|nr:right-handed parallel beta-helix repeat-containing protein [Nitrosospira multiformis]SEM74499.1 hypothetical protein SAMN05216404_10137 [Nitrosospira multiformis]
MADWYVRPDTSHSGTRDGTSYGTAWGGWTEIVWGGAGVKGGDTLYVCGAHTYSQIIRPEWAGSSSNRITIRGDYATEPGSITFVSGAYYFNLDKSYVTLQSLTITAGNNRCIGVTGVPNTGFWLKNCTLIGSAITMVDFMAINNFAYVDTVIDGNIFVAGTGSGISWRPSGAMATNLSNMQISNNAFNGVSGPRGVITFLSLDDVLAGTKMTDIRIFGNTYTDCGGVAIECYGPTVYGRNSGIKVYDNTITNQQKVGLLGGGIVLGGFGLSATPDFGPNDVYNNKCYGLHGLSGLANIFYGTYRVFNNYAENITTADIDGCGILFDHDCRDSVAFGNEIRDLWGNGNPDNSIRPSGSGILMLDATNCTAYGNLIVNCVTGISFGNKLSGQSSNIFNNTFINCSYAGAYMMATANNTTNVIRNNIFTTTTDTTPAVRVNSAVWTGESNNCFHGFGANVGHTFAISSNTNNPDFNDAYRPQSVSCKRNGVYLGGKDFHGKHFYNPPNIGAVDDTTNTPRYTLRYR